MTRALANLLDNAVRETPPGGTVTTAISGEPGVVVVMIDDQCGGMAPEQLRLLSAARAGSPAAMHFLASVCCMAHSGWRHPIQSANLSYV